MIAPQAFAYHRAVAPMLWVLVIVASIELVVVHLLVAFWWPGLALGLSAVTLVAIGWLVAGIRSFRALPVLLDDRTLILRTGRLRRIAVPVGNIAEAFGERDRAALKAMGAANFALVAHPNVVVRLAEPVRWRGRTVRAVAHRLDDAPAFLRALSAIRAGA